MAKLILWKVALGDEWPTSMEEQSPDGASPRSSSPVTPTRPRFMDTDHVATFPDLDMDRARSPSRRSPQRGRSSPGSPTKSPCSVGSPRPCYSEGSNNGESTTTDTRSFQPSLLNGDEPQLPILCFPGEETGGKNSGQAILVMDLNKFQ
jgi:hypothetical protein